MPAPTLGEDLFTIVTQRDHLLYKVEGNAVAVAMPAPQPHNERAWHVSLFDPFGGPPVAAMATDEASARDLSVLFARTAARAANR